MKLPVQFVQWELTYGKRYTASESSNGAETAGYIQRIENLNDRQIQECPPPKRPYFSHIPWYWPLANAVGAVASIAVVAVFLRLLVVVVRAGESLADGIDIRHVEVRDGGRVAVVGVNTCI